MGHHLHSGHTLGIELDVPSRVERVGKVDAFAVPADLDHLRAAPKGLPAWVRAVLDDAADPDRAGELGLSRIGHVVLAQLSRAPAGDVEETVIERKVDVCDQ